MLKRKCHKAVSPLWAIFFLLTVVIADGLGLSELLLKKVEQQYGGSARMRVESWDQLVRDNSQLSIEKKLEVVNRFFNQLAFTSDQEHWGLDDYWATPVEFLSTNGGDCEDFSIAKYFTLREMGVPVDAMRLTYVKAVKLNQAHMILAYYSVPDAEPLVLDNLVNDIQLASMRRDLVPVYGFNGEGLWLAKERGMGQRVGGADRLQHWKDLTHRMRKFRLKETDAQN